MASTLLQFIFPKNSTLGAAVPSGTVAQSFIVEGITTFFLMITILGMTDKKEFSNISGLIIGLLVTGLIFFAGPISGGSFNPARSLSPALVSRNFNAIWIYMFAPTLGAIAAVFVWKGFHKTT